jgi:TRAP-type C4-dicarboxylate transport system substrate-binding protein
VRRSLAALLVLACAAPASADPQYRLRIATAAPDGTSFAREFRAFARDVEASTNGAVQVKWYFGGIAGDETEVEGRIRRGQLDGTASAGVMCARLAPTMRATRLPGLYESREEATWVFSHLTGALTNEFARAGFVYLGGPSLGPEVLFSRTPVTTFADWKKLKVWRWDIDEVALLISKEMGMNGVPLPFDKAQAAYDDHRIDGFLVIPAGALAFQWSSNARYVLKLSTTFISGCLLVANRAFDSIPVEHQKAIRAAAAKGFVRVSESGRIIDEQLLGSLFERQGLHAVEPSAELRRDFIAAAHEAVIRLGPRLMPPALLEEVTRLVAEYRASHQHAAR